MVSNDVTKSYWVSDGLSDELRELLELLFATKKSEKFWIDVTDQIEGFARDAIRI